MEPVQQPLNIQTLIEGQGLHIAVLEAQIARCQALRFTVEHRVRSDNPRLRAHQSSRVRRVSTA